MTAVRKHKLPEASGSDVDRLRLFELIKSLSFATGNFTLSSGQESRFYFDLKPTLMHPEGSFLAAHAFMRRALQARAEFVGGLEMGAVPILGAIAALSFAEQTELQTFFVRKEPKKHGTRKSIEGLTSLETLRNKRVVIVDDVATRGASIFTAVEKAREAGAKVDTAVSLLDREEGAAEYLSARGVTLLAVFRASEFTR